MRPFRFRPQAALDLRIKQEEQALTALAVAQRALDAAIARKDAAIERSTSAADAFASAQRSGVTGTVIGWHRSWIARQRLEVDARRRETAVSAAGVERATASVRAAHQRRRTLERLRARAGRKYQQDVQREDTKEMTQLAGLRYLSLTTGDGGSDRDDESHDRRGGEQRRDERAD
jgi:flagellar export protein FliJ